MKLRWNANEKLIFKDMAIPFDVDKDLSDDELEYLFEGVDDYRWTHEGYDGKGKPGMQFLTCENIMDRIEDVLAEHGLVN